MTRSFLNFRRVGVRKRKLQVASGKWQVRSRQLAVGWQLWRWRFEKTLGGAVVQQAPLVPSFLACSNRGLVSGGLPRDFFQPKRNLFGTEAVLGHLRNGEDRIGVELDCLADEDKVKFQGVAVAV